MDKNPLVIKIPSLLENIRIVESFIDQAKETLQFDEDIYGNILISVTETVNNAIIHGNKEDKEKNVTLSINSSNANISFSIEDEGTGFDHHHLPDPTDPENINKIGGRGIYLMKHLADEVNFSEKGNKVELVFYLN